MVYGYIYKIENLVNGKVYIGQTTQNPNYRRRQHFKLLRDNKHQNSHLQHSFNKYGLFNFEFIIINYGTSKEVLDQLEDDYINYYDCLNQNKGYNLKNGGTNGLPSDETRLKLSKANSGKNNAMYGMKGPLAPMYGKKHSIHTIKKISESKKGKKRLPFTDEWKQNISRANKGRKLSEAHKHKISEAHKGKVVSSETKRKMSENRRGVKYSPETRKKIFKLRRGRGMFGFTGVRLNKHRNFERRCWWSAISWEGKDRFLGNFEDPLSAEIVHDLVLNEFLTLF